MPRWSQSWRFSWILLGKQQHGLKGVLTWYMVKELTKMGESSVVYMRQCSRFVPEHVPSSINFEIRPPRSPQRDVLIQELPVESVDGPTVESLGWICAICSCYCHSSCLTCYRTLLTSITIYMALLIKALRKTWLIGFWYCSSGIACTGDTQYSMFEYVQISHNT